MALWTRLDPTSVDLTDFDVVDLVRTTVEATGAVRDRSVELAKDATYVTVGLGLLSFQRAQVRRREIERALRR
jgi:hypothetical protein